MGESEEKHDKNERRFSQEQYDRLIECSKRGPEGIKEWNKWREKRRYEKIWLQGAKLRKANLQGADLMEANLQGAKLAFANLQGAYLENAKLQGAYLRHAYLERAFLEEAKLQGADLIRAKLQKADLMDANLQGAKLVFANLQGADLVTTNLEGADLREAKLEGADLREAKLQGAIFWGSVVNGSTSFLDCEINQSTDFRNTGLDNVRIESGTKYLLKYNIRRLNWEDWYKDHSLLKWLVKTFWWMSDYGRSTGRVVGTFFILALVFATIYYICGLIGNQGIVSSLFEGREGPVPDWLVPFRAIYFSIVTMTTLGFGDMHANCQSFLGHLLLTIQVILGYVLLGAMVTRLAVLFTADGPEGSFTPMSKETKEFLAKLKKDKKPKDEQKE